jgi:hypothetical protein
MGDTMKSKISDEELEFYMKLLDEDNRVCNTNIGTEDTNGSGIFACGCCYESSVSAGSCAVDYPGCA